MSNVLWHWRLWLVEALHHVTLFLVDILQASEQNHGLASSIICDVLKFNYASCFFFLGQLAALHKRREVYFGNDGCRRGFDWNQRGGGRAAAVYFGQYWRFDFNHQRRLCLRRVDRRWRVFVIALHY